MTRPPLTRADVGCWVVKSNPKDVWNYFKFRNAPQSGPNKDGLFRYWWTLSGTYRNGLMRGGDLIVIWITGPDDPGIYEIGEVTGAVKPGVIDARYLVDASRAGEIVDMVPLRSFRLPVPLSRSLIRSTPVLAECEQMRTPRMSNPTYLTPGETAALGHRLFARVPAPVADGLGWGHLIV